MKMEITEKKENKILKRTEVRFTIDHKGESTPSKGAVLEEIAKKLNAKKDQIVLNNIDSVYGNGVSTGYAKVYESKEIALEHEREYLLKRNGIEAKAPETAEAPAEE